jgi:hypothetical protein
VLSEVHRGLVSVCIYSSTHELNLCGYGVLAEVHRGLVRVYYRGLVSVY